MERPHIIVMKSVDCLSQSFFMYSVSKNARFDFSQEKKETFHKIVQTFAISAMCFEGQPLNGGYCYDTLKADQVVKSLTREIAPVCQKVRGVIAYLEGLNDGDIFYIISADIPVSERMRSHLAVKAMAMHHNVEDSLRHFDETWGALFGKYRFLSFGRDGCCEYVGEPEKKARVCRFCGRKYPDARYKEIAHAIPEGLGNKILFCNEECDDCNGRLARVEENLTHYLGVKRALSGVLSKSSKSIPSIDGKGFVIRGNENKEPILYLEKEFVERHEVKDRVVNLKLETEDLISHQGIFKALCKIVIDLLPSKELPHFTETIKWINGELIPDDQPSYFAQYNRLSYTQPVIDIFLSNNPGSEPYCTALLYVLDSVFLFVVPEVDVDGIGFCKDSEVEAHLGQFMSLVKGRDWIKEDTSEFHMSYPWIQMSVNLDHPNVKILPASDPVFNKYDRTKNFSQTLCFPEFTEDGISEPELKSFMFKKYADVENGAEALRHISVNIYRQSIILYQDQSKLLVSCHYMFADSSNTTHYFSVEFEAEFKMEDFDKYIRVNLNEKTFAFNRDLRTNIMQRAASLADTKLRELTAGTSLGSISLASTVNDERFLRKTSYLIPNGEGLFWRINDAQINML